MLLSHIIVAAISAVYVTASIDPAPAQSALDGVVYRTTPLAECANRIRELETTVPDIVVEDEPKLIQLTTSALHIVNECHSAVKSGFALVRLSDAETIDELNAFSQVMVRTLQVCKSIHSTRVADTINIISGRMLEIQIIVQNSMPTVADRMFDPLWADLDKMHIISFTMSSMGDTIFDFSLGQ